MNNNTRRTHNNHLWITILTVSDNLTEIRSVKNQNVNTGFFQDLLDRSDFNNWQWQESTVLYTFPLLTIKIHANGENEKGVIAWHDTGWITTFFSRKHCLINPGP